MMYNVFCLLGLRMFLHQNLCIYMWTFLGILISMTHFHEDNSRCVVYIIYQCALKYWLLHDHPAVIDNIHIVALRQYQCKYM